MSEPTTPESLVPQWRARADLFRRHGANDLAMAIEALASELDGALRAGANELLKLREAAAESGYSEEHLARLVRDGKIPNQGRRGAPRIRHEDLPRKANILRESAPRGRSRVQIARSVVTSMQGARP